MWPAADPIVIVAEATPPWRLPSGVSAFAPGTPPGTWPAAALPVPFVLAIPAGRDAAEGDAAAELDVALRAWTRPSCTAWRARFDGARAAEAADDGLNVILFHDDAWPPELAPGAAAQTVVHTDAAGRYRDADVHLNSHEFRFSLDGATGTLDLRSVLVHELGHALGLGHSGDARATMFPTGSGLRWRSLERDDVAGVCALYPGPAGAPGCRALPCPAPFLCVADACQRPSDRADVCAPCARVPGACEAAGDDARCIDLGTGASAGRVCGRACAADGECGAGFRCLPTTASGDLQCVSDVGCANGAFRCGPSAPCAIGTCRAGACVGPAPEAASDAGAPDSGAPVPEAGEHGTDALVPSGGCACRVPPAPPRAEPGAQLVIALLGALTLGAARRARRPR